jgi:hypothetical protein
MWRYSLSFFASAFAAAILWRSMVNPADFLEEVALIGGAFVFILWLGDGLFIRGLISDEDDARRLRALLATKPRFASRLLVIGVIYGSAAAILTILALGITESDSTLRFRPWSIAALAIPIVS